MRTRATRGRGAPALAAAALLLLAPACGGGKNSFVGVGNSGNRIYPDDVDEVAELLAEWEATPRVSDETIRQVYEAILAHARSGDPAAARIVLLLAEHQREDEAEAD